MTLDYKILGQLYYGADIIRRPGVEEEGHWEGSGYGYGYGEGQTWVIDVPGQPPYDETIILPKVIYTVPNNKQTTVTSIYVTNQDTVQRTYDLAIVPAGQTLSVKHHIRWDMPVKAGDIDNINAKLTLNSGDRIYVFPSTVDKVGFTVFGVEKS